MSWQATRDRVRDHTESVIADLHAEWGSADSVPEFDYGPQPWHPDEPPESVDGVLDVFAGIASAVTFYTDRREETVLVYNRGGYWEPPGGAIEADETPAETAKKEAREETGLDVELVDLLYTTTVTLQYSDGSDVPLPVAAFAARRVDGTLTVERETNDHPGVTRAVGLFDSEVLPESCRDYERIHSLLEAETT